MPKKLQQWQYLCCASDLLVLWADLCTLDCQTKKNQQFCNSPILKSTNYNKSESGTPETPSAAAGGSSWMPRNVEEDLLQRPRPATKPSHPEARQDLSHFHPGVICVREYVDLDGTITIWDRSSMNYNSSSWLFPIISQISGKDFSMLLTWLGMKSGRFCIHIETTFWVMTSDVTQKYFG